MRIKFNRVAEGFKVISAGFFYPADEFNEMGGCFGRSESLNVDSSPEKDTELLNNLVMVKD